MHDFAGTGVIIATVIASSLIFNKAVNDLRNELLSEIATINSCASSLRADLISKLDSIQSDMRSLFAEHIRHSQRITNLEQQHKS